MKQKFLKLLFAFTLVFAPIAVKAEETIVADNNVQAVAKVTVAPKVTLAGDNNSIKITWEAVENATSYDVYRATSKKGKYTRIYTNLTKTTVTNSKLTYGKTYYYKVVAKNSAGSKTSAIVSKKVVPNKVSNLTASTSTNVAKVTWDKVSASGYVVQMSTDKKTWKTVKTITSGSNVSAKVTGLTGNKTYYFRVRAYKTVNKSKIYGSYSAVLETKTAPVAPTISVGAYEYDTAKITVNTVKGATKYEIYRSEKSDGTYTKVGELEVAGEYLDETLPTVEYFYKVRGCNGTSCGNYSKVLSTTTNVKTLTDTTVTSVGGSSVTLTWEEVSYATGYSVWMATSKSGSYEKLGMVYEPTMIIENLIPGKTYYFKVRTYKTIDGENYYSPAAKAKVVSGTPTINQVSELNVVNSEIDNAVIVSWAEQESVTGYEVYRLTAEDETYELVGTVETNEYEDTDVEDNQTYYYKVRAFVTLDGKTYNGKYSSVESIIFEDNIAIVSFDSNGGSDVDSQNVELGSKVTEPEDPTKEGYTFQGWFDGEEEYDFDSEVTTDLTLLAKWEINTYTITLDLDEDTTYDGDATIEVEYGNTVTILEPTKIGHDFQGWFIVDENNEVTETTLNSNTIIKSDIKVVAIFEPTRYTITFNTNGGNEIDDQEVEYLDKVTTPTEPEREGYTFVSWFNGENEYDFESSVTENITLVAKWKINTYQVTFDSNGGSAITGLKVKYGQEVGQPLDPTRTGYTFAGWFNGETEYDFESLVTGNITLTANWTINTYTVTFDSNGGSTVASETVNYNETFTTPTNPTKTGYTFAGWTLNEEAYDFTTPATENITLVANWTINTYTVTFNSNGGSTVTNQNVAYGSKATTQETTKEGYDFLGWYNGNTEYDFNTEVTSAVTLDAKWMRNIVTELATKGNSIKESYYNKFTNGFIIRPTRNQNADKFDADNFYIEIGEYTGETTPETITIAEDTYTLTGTSDFGYWISIGMNAWLGAPVYKVEGGKLYVAVPWLVAESVPENNLTIVLGDETYIVKTYDTDLSSNELKISAVEPMATIEGSINIVTYDLTTSTYINKLNNGANSMGVNIAISNDGENFTDITDASAMIFRLSSNGQMGLASPEEGYSYGVYPFAYGDSLLTDTTLHTSDSFKLAIPGYGSVTFKFDASVPTSTVTFDTDGGSEVDSVTVVTGNTITLPANPTKQHYVFSKWVVVENGEATETEFTESTKTTGDVTIKAVYTKEVYTVTFNSNGGSSVAPQNVEYGSTVTKPTNPTKEHYGFVKWTLNGDDYEFNTEVSENITLDAVWAIDEFTVEFDSNEGTEVASQTVNYGDTATEPTAPTRDGYDFVEWQIDGEKYNFSTTVTGDITLTAKWTLKKYKVTFNTNGGSTIKPLTVRYGQEISEPSEPTKTGYNFVGWYIGETEYDFETGITEDITLIARWQIQTFTVEFVNGEERSSQIVNYGSKVTAPTAPTKEHYTFAGWFNGENEYNFESSVTEDIELTANWAIKTYTVTYNVDGGSEVASETVNYNETFTTPINPTKTGYTFAGWTLNEETYNFTTPATENITLVANWTINKYTVTFDTDGAEPIASQKIKYNKLVNEPSEPEKEGYTFKAWTLDGKVFDFETKVTKDITLVATYTREAVSEINTKAASLKTTYYNQYNDNDVLTASDLDDNYYVEVGYYDGNALSSIKVGSDTYTTANYDLSIGMNAKISAPVWKVVDNKLYVATTWLVVESMPGKVLTVTAGDYKYDVRVWNTSTNTLSIDSVLATRTLAGKVNTVSYSGGVATVTSNNGTQTVSLIISKDGQPIIDTNAMVYRLNDKGNMGFTAPEKVASVAGGTLDTDVTYELYTRYKNGDYTDEDYEAFELRVFKLAIPGEGVVNITFDLVKPE